MRAIVRGYLRQLAESPAAISRSSSFPWPPGRQVFEFNVDFGLETWDRFSVQFRYGQDEQTLIVLVIGHISYRRESEGGGADAR
jgi:hypothetical protein